ncbi:MAG: hypothetical protein WA941_05415 [Nitrososphaeraceae archaeon]
MRIVTELRHLDGLIGGIAVSESEYMSTTALKWKELLDVAFYSNEEEVVKSGQYVFDTFWEKAIPTKRRIKEIEENLRREFINTIQDPEDRCIMIFSPAMIFVVMIFFVGPQCVGYFVNLSSI